MSISYESDDSQSQTPLLSLDATPVDFAGRPVNRSCSGGWRSAMFIIGVEVAERFAFYGIALNLMVYLTGPLGQSTVEAAKNVNLWSGATTLLPLFGAFIADSFLGRYTTILIASIIYILGLGMLSVTAMFPLSDFPYTKETSSQSQLVMFYLALYIIAIAQSGHKPCVQAFGADQFDENDRHESKGRSSFFNWWYFCMNAGIVVSNLSLPYIMDNLNWSLGFGIPCFIMILALAIFLMGTRTYRFVVRSDRKNPFARIGGVFFAAVKNWRTTPDASPQQASQKFKFLNRALLKNVCTSAEVEEAREVLSLGPIWASSLIYGIVFAQSSTFFTKQGSSMDRTTPFGVNIPPASLQSLISIAVMILVPIYDLVLIPFTRKITGTLSGITMLQRIGIGLLVSAFSMVIAALIEQKRLQTALQNDNSDDPNATVLMSVWWLTPQYILFGVADVFTMVGLQEFFYEQVPNELRSMGLSLYLSIFGFGSVLSSFLISMVECVTSYLSKDSWFSDDLNFGHLDRFYWLLAGVSFLGFGIYVNSASSYVYKKSAVHS